MKIVSLNTWGGKVFDPLVSFIREQREDTDIFCFQEVLENDSDLVEVLEYQANLLDVFKNILVDYNFYFYPDFFLTENGITIFQGSAVFVKNDIKILSKDSRLIYQGTEQYDPEKNHSANAVFLEIEKVGKSIVVMSYHGIGFPGDKLDTEDRIDQSRKLVELMEMFSSPKILCGDFNLMPETESVRIIEEVGMKNLIKDFGVKDTRGKINAEQYPDSTQHFADYTFVSFGIRVKSFEVPDAEISDHCPMILEIDY